MSPEALLRRYGATTAGKLQTTHHLNSINPRTRTLLDDGAGLFPSPVFNQYLKGRGLTPFQFLGLQAPYWYYPDRNNLET